MSNQVQRDSNAWDSSSLKSWDVISEVSSLASEQGVPRVDLHKLLLEMKTMMEKLAAKTEVQRDSNAWDLASLKSWDVTSEVEGELTKAYLDEQLRGRDEAIARLSQQMEAMKPALEQMSALKLKVGRARPQMKQLRSEQSRLQATAEAGMAKLEALKGAAVETEKMRVASKELVEELNQLKRDKDELAAQLADVQGSMQKNHAETANEILEMKSGNDVGYEQLSKQVSDLKHAVAQLTGATQAAVQDVAALKERMEEMEAKALKTIHAFDVFAHLTFGTSTRRGNVYEHRITVTLVRGGDASSLASAVAPSCKLCEGNGKLWVDDPEALRQYVTRLLASHTGGPEQRWAYVAYWGTSNLSRITPDHLKKRKPLPKSCGSPLDSVEWFQAWLRSSPAVAITDADVVKSH